MKQEDIEKLGVPILWAAAIVVIIAYILLTATT